MLIRRIISESKHTHYADLSIKAKARELRKNMTDAELLLWKHIRNKGINNIHFRRQHPYGIYIIDFFCSKANLALELDGDIHKFKSEYDCERTKYLEESGLKVLRFSNYDVENNIEEVINKIKSAL